MNNKEIADDIREHSEPWFVEIRTYRYRGHSMSDPQKYRTKEELEEMMRDPRYHKDRDPHFVKQVTEGFQALYPNRG